MISASRSWSGIGDLTISFWQAPPVGESTRVKVLNAVIVIDLIVLVGLILHLTIREIVTQPLWAFIEASQRVARGEFDSPIKVIRGSREEEELASNFNEMVAKLAQSQKELVEANTSLEERVAIRTRELVRSKAFSEAVIATVREGIYAVDSEKRITTFNQGAEAITGLSAAEVVGRPCYDVMKYPFCQTDCILERLHAGPGNDETSPEEWLDLGDEERRTWVISGGLFHDEKAVPMTGTGTKTGTETGTEAEAEAEADADADADADAETGIGIGTYETHPPQNDAPDARFPGGVETIKDLSHIRRLQDQLRRADKLSSLGTLAAGIAHELNNPLSNIRIYAQLMDEDIPADSKDSETVSHIITQSDRASSIVRKMLEFAGGGTGDAFEPLSIPEVISQALGMVGYRLETSQITVRLITGPDLPPIEGHRVSLQQVLINLFTNASQAMNGTQGILAVQASLGPDRETVEIRIADTGEGMDTDRQSRIFDPFFTSKEVGEGTGLGLSISYGIVKEHGGDIRVESRPRRPRDQGHDHETGENQTDQDGEVMGNQADQDEWTGLTLPSLQSSLTESAEEGEVPGEFSTIFTISLPAAALAAVDRRQVLH